MEHSQWQSLLKLGNDCFHDKEWNQAEFFYSEAYDLLAFSYRNNPMCAGTLMAWICACHNLSSLYEAKQDLDLSLKFLMVPHEYLLEITESKIDNEDVKLIAFKGLSITLSPVLSFAKKYPICDECLDKFTSLKSFIEQKSQPIH